MKVNDFLTEESKKLIREAVVNVEKTTAGEIRVAVIEKCKAPFFHSWFSTVDTLTYNRALEEFSRLGMSATRDKTGVLICLFLREKKVWVIGDQAINEKVPPGTWDQAVALIIESIKDPSQDNGAGICKAVELIGKHLAEHFPRKQDDTDELPDDVVVEKE